jgi:hypothetical protein
MSNFKRRLASHLLVAQKESEDNIQELRVLTDDASHKLANKIFKTYVSEDDFSKFHSFLIDMDRLLARFGGQSPKVLLRPNAPQGPQQPQVQQQQSSQEDDDK